METWKIQALISAFFAGVTAVIAKFGLENISADLAVAIRTAVILVFVTANVFLWRSTAGFAQLTARQFGFLALSGVTTSLSWIFYYRAIKDGQVSFVALIDKGSILVSVLLAFLILREPITPRVLSGAGLILAGLLVLTVRR
jgi:bacterial/archaeal transporter family protein